jgi:hypothetical protein
MKAEQRKELETNALADRMGHLVQRVKTQPRRSTLYYVIGAAAIGITLIVAFQWYKSNQRQDSQRWQFVYVGARDLLDAVEKEAPDSNQAKAARFQEAWFLYWDAGIRMIGRKGKGQGAMGDLGEAEKQYRKLAEECKDDPIWESEAMYGLALIEETRAVAKSDALDSAKKRYEELANKHPKTARGMLAKEWLANYDDKSKKEELVQFYDEMRRSIDIPLPELTPKKGPPIKEGKLPSK